MADRHCNGRTCVDPAQIGETAAGSGVPWEPLHHQLAS
jgi:hypothetical protein